MEVEYSQWINEFFCSPDCATNRYFNYMESTPLDFDNTLPEGVIVVNGLLDRAAELPDAPAAAVAGSMIGNKDEDDRDVESE